MRMTSQQTVEPVGIDASHPLNRGLVRRGFPKMIDLINDEYREGGSVKCEEGDPPLLKGLVSWWKVIPMWIVAEC